MHVTQLERCADAGIVDQFRESIGYTTGPDIVYAQNRVSLTQLPATVYHFLRASFQFWVTALHRIKIQIFHVAAGVHARSCAATQTNQHGRAAQLNKGRACRDRVLFSMLGGNIAYAAGQHNRLVVATHFALTLGIHTGQFKGAEITGNVRTTKLVTVSRAA